MIIEGPPLEQADAVMAYCVANKVACLYYDLRTYILNGEINPFIKSYLMEFGQK